MSPNTCQLCLRSIQGGEGRGEVGVDVRPRTRRARNLRQNATESERLLWRALRELNLPVNVRRQHPIGRYIVDFAIPAYKLAIEIDGEQHATAVGQDAARTRDIEGLGYRVIRFWNNDVIGNLPGVLETISTEIGNSPTSP